MDNAQSRIQGILGIGAAADGDAEASDPALNAIATNGSLLLQNISKLTLTLSVILTAWGA